MGTLSLFNAVLTTVGVLVLAYWCCRVLGKRWGTGNPGSTGSLKVIEGIQVGQDRRILLLKAGKHVYLVGVSPAGIQLLSEMEEDFVLPDMPEESQNGAMSSFQEIMEKYIKRHTEKNGVDR